MPEPTWISRIVNCREAYKLDSDEIPAVDRDDIYLTLDTHDGRQYRLRLSPQAAQALYDLLTALHSNQAKLVRVRDENGGTN